MISMVVIATVRVPVFIYPTYRGGGGAQELGLPSAMIVGIRRRPTAEETEWRSRA